MEVMEGHGLIFQTCLEMACLGTILHLGLFENLKFHERCFLEGFEETLLGEKLYFVRFCGVPNLPGWVCGPVVLENTCCLHIIEVLKYVFFF